MKKYSKFDVILNLWISSVINVVLSIVLPALVGMLSFGTFLKGFVIAFTVSTILVFLIPVVDWGAKFASLFGLKPGTAGFTLVSTIVLALFLGTIMTLLMTAVNAGIGPLPDRRADGLSVRPGWDLYREPPDKSNCRRRETMI